MPIRKIQFVPGNFYHIFNRGNARQDIFYSVKDMYRFLQTMYLSNNSNPTPSIGELERSKSGYTLIEIKEILDARKISQNPLVRIMADCLMPNHYHFFLQEIQKGGITRFMHRFGDSYGKFFAIKYDRPGSLFQGRFKVVSVENDDQCKYLLAYINVINPAELAEPHLKEKGIKNPKRVWEMVENYSWSTHQEYMNKRESIIIDKGLLGKFFPTPEDYCRFVKDILHSKEKEKKMWGMIENLTLD